MEKVKIGTRIGVVTLKYNKTSESLYSIFTPEIKVGKKNLPALDAVHISKNEEKMKEEVQEAVAKWFAGLNEIELADREKFVIKTNLVKCNKYKTGEVKEAKFDVVMGNVD